VTVHPFPKMRATKIPFRWATHIDGDPTAEQVEIVEDLLTAGAMSCIYGDSNTGKSYLASHLCFCLVENRKFLGKRVRAGSAIYIAGEGASSIRQRVRAYKSHHGALLENFGLVETAINLLDADADLPALIALIASAAQEIGSAVQLVVIDTVARAMGDGDENSTADMGRLVAAGDRIREQTGAHVLFVHHSGKNQLLGARGSSALRAALDTEFATSKDEAAKLHTLEITKQRDLASVGLRLSGRFVPVELGLNQWGNPITACIVEDAETPPKRAREIRLPKGSETAMETLRELAADSIQVSTETSVMPGGRRLVNVEKWRDRYYQRRGTTGDEPASTRRSEWNRAKKALIDAKTVGVWGENAWIW